MAGRKIVNEDFVDNVVVLKDKLEMQLGDDKVIGCSMFFLIKAVDGKDYWTVISNYGAPLSDANMLYLHQSVARHLSKDFSGVDYGPEDEREE